jgi:hypothetical protein
MEHLPATTDEDETRALADHVSAVRTQVRRDLHATSLPLLLVGAAVGLVPSVVLIVGGFPWPVDDLLGSLLVISAFGALWLIYRRRALKDGVGSSGAPAAAAVLGVVLVVITSGMVMFLTGPFLLVGLGLLIVGLVQHRPFLTGWAIFVGGIGVFEGFFGITNRLPDGSWDEMWHEAIYVALAILTVLAGIVARLRENYSR